MAPRGCHGAIDRGTQRRNEAAPLRGVGLNDVFGRTICAISVSPSRLWVELKDAQLLGAATGFRDARGPRDGLLARGQFEYGEAAVERGRPRIATLGDRAVGRDEHGRYVFVDADPEEVNAGCLRLVGHGERLEAKM